MTRRSVGSQETGIRSRARLATVIAALAAALLVVLTFAGPTLADPPGKLPDAPPHRHFIETSNGLVPVGPQICEKPELQQAFNEFHYNIHHSVLPGIGGGPVTTLGPQDGAPGLHNDLGADLVAMPGCPQP